MRKEGRAVVTTLVYAFQGAPALVQNTLVG